MSDMVQSFDFTTSSTNITDSMNIGLLIARNIQTYMQYSRSTNNQHSRGTDAQVSAVNAVTASFLQTPLRVVILDNKTTVIYLNKLANMTKLACWISFS